MTTTTGSVNIAVLDLQIIGNLCTGAFTVDLSPSSWIGSGADNVMGASLKITNPYNVVVKNYPTSGYDFYPPMTDEVDFNVPTQAGNYQYGTYKFDVLLTDADGTQYTVSKTLNICAPDAKNKNRKYGSLSAQLNGICKEGKIYVIADNVPTYKGVISDSQTNAFTLEYPTSSGLSVLSTAVGSFSAVLFEGVYKFTGTICANYDLGDHVSVLISYKVKREKNIRCALDESCIYERMAQLNEQVKSDCGDAEKADTQNVIINSLRLLKTIEISVNAGFDASDYISELEDLLGCVCTCNCADGTPIINNDPAKDFSITGCNVDKTTVGLTDIYVIDNFEYVVEVTDNGGAIQITAPTLADCTKTQTITFNIAVVYSQIKNQIDDNTEYNFWASIIKNALSGLDGTCLGLTTPQLNALTLKQLIQAIITNQCVAGTCDAEIAADDVVNTAADVLVSWTNVADVYEVAAYLDGELKGTVLFPGTSYNFVGAADGDSHIWTLVSKCSNGSIGGSLSGDFTYFGCPTIAVPTVSSVAVTDDCPYDLTSLVDALPVGITAEWHNLNNTNNSSLVTDPTQAIGGVYFLFGKNADGCYSLSRQIILTCSAGTNCSAPQNLLVESITGGLRARFQSAAYPPPLNSYTVKRRLTADADVTGSYTTIGTPTWNATVSRWEILDATALDNTLYTYRAISNCDSSAPYVDYVFANITCAVVTLTRAETEIDYSFTSVSANITKYEVRIYESDGVTLVHTDTILPAYAVPITGTFIYLTGTDTYNVRLRAYIGTFYKDCAFVNSPAFPANFEAQNNYTEVGGFLHNVLGVTGLDFASEIGNLDAGESGTSYHDGFTGIVSIVITGVLDPSTDATVKLFKNGVEEDSIDIGTTTGTYPFASDTYSVSDVILVVLQNTIAP